MAVARWLVAAGLAAERENIRLLVVEREHRPQASTWLPLSTVRECGPERMVVTVVRRGSGGLLAL
jgi:hypothetical protein